MAWYKALQVTATNGSDIVRVISGEFVDAIRPEDGLEIGQFNAVEILSAYTEVGGAEDEIIQLAEDWPHATQTLQPAKVIPNAAYFNAGATALATTRDKVFTHLGSFFDFGNQASGNVTFTGVGVGNADVTVRCLKQWETDLSALEDQVTGSVDDVAAIDAQVNTPVTGLLAVTADAIADLATIDSTLTGYRDTTEGYKNTTLGYRDQVSTWYGTIDGWQSTISGQVTTVNNAAGAASTSESNASDSETLAQQYASHPHNTLIPVVGGYSALHWKEEASAIAGGNFVPETRTVNGLQLDVNITLDADDVGARDDTWVPSWTDVTSKPTTFTPATHSHAISDVTNLQTNLDLKAPLESPTFTGTVGGVTKAMVGLTDVDDTSDADKPISTAVQAELDKIKIFAYAGMVL